VASCTLDASVKIYSCRVDSIHQDTFKVLGGLSRSGNNKADEEDGEAAGGGEEGSTSKKKSHRSVNTIEANPSNLNVKKFDLEFDVDPLFHKVRGALAELGDGNAFSLSVCVGACVCVCVGVGGVGASLALQLNSSRRKEEAFQCVTICCRLTD